MFHTKINNHFPSLRFIALPFIALFFTFATTSETDEIKWEEAALDVDDMPFTVQYIDSIKQANNVAPLQSSLRKLKQTIPCEAETLVYDIAWGPFKAGYVILTVEPDEKNGVIRLGGKALSNNFISAFYRMRDYVISTIDTDGLYPLLFEQHLREGKKYKMDGYILFDNVAGKIHVQEKKFKSFESPQFIHDYMSILYYIRTMKILPGDDFTLNLFIHKKVHPIQFKCKTRKQIEVDAGVFNCILLEPKLAGEGRAFNKKDKMIIWLTDDKSRIPVLIRSKIKLGSVTAKLIWRGGSTISG